MCKFGSKTYAHEGLWLHRSDVQTLRYEMYTNIERIHKQYDWIKSRINCTSCKVFSKIGLNLKVEQGFGLGLLIKRNAVMSKPFTIHQNMLMKIKLIQKDLEFIWQTTSKCVSWCKII